MQKNPAKEIIKLQLAGLLVGTGLAASIQFGIRLIPFEDSFFSYASILYFLAGLFFGFFIPGLSWKGGIWITLPWIVRTFFVIASTGFKDGIPASIGWLLLYSLPILPASAGTYAGGLMAKLISSIRKG
jgi:hypothetical protein